MTALVDNTFTVSMLGLHMSLIHQAVLLFQAKSPEQKQTTLYVQNPNCTQLCHEAWASQCTHRALINSARQPVRLLVAHFWKQGYERVCVQACACMCVVVGECLFRKSKILQHRSLQLVVYWKQARAPAPQVDQPLPRHCGKLGGLRNMEECLSPGLCVQSMDCWSTFANMLFSPVNTE